MFFFSLEPLVKDRASSLKEISKSLNGKIKREGINKGSNSGGGQKMAHCNELSYRIYIAVRGIQCFPEEVMGVGLGLRLLKIHGEAHDWLVEQR